MHDMVPDEKGSGSRHGGVAEPRKEYLKPARESTRTRAERTLHTPNNHIKDETTERIKKQTDEGGRAVAQENRPLAERLEQIHDNPMPSERPRPTQEEG